MNALQLFRNILMPHLWLNKEIISAGAGMIGASAIGALGGILGGGGSEGAKSGWSALPQHLKTRLREAGVSAEELYG